MLVESSNGAPPWVLLSGHFMKKGKLVDSSHRSFIYVQFIACKTKEPDPIILFMEEILHQLIGGLSHYLQDFIHPGGSGFLPSTVGMLLIHNSRWFRE